MICRLCLVETTSDFLNIFDSKGIRLQIAEIISKHLWFRPSKDDSISDKVCCSCWTRVASFHEFYCFIEDTQKKLVNILQSNSSSFCSSELLPVVLIDLEKQDSCSKFNKLSIKDYLSSEYEETIIENIDPLTYENFKIEDEHNDIVKKIEITIRDEFIDSQDEKNERITRSVSSRNKNFGNTTKNSNILNKTKTSSNQKYLTKQGQIQKNCKKQKSAQRKKIEEQDELIAKFVRMECDICSDNFNCFSELQNHMIKKHKHPKGYVVCCNKKISRRGFLLDHINLHINPEAFLCTICDKTFCNNQSLRYHISIRHNVDKSKVLTCDQCQKTFTCKTLFRKHKLIHVPLEQRHFQCQQCKKTYATKQLLDYHIRDAHEKCYGLVCDICGKRLRSKALMNEHCLEHNGVMEPKIQCQECGSWLKNERILKIHMRSHAESLLGLKCNICGREARNKGALREHVKYVHEKQKIFKCTFCEKAFKRKKALIEHMTIHTGGALYTCTFCPRTFNANTNMYQHRKRVHPKEWEELNRQRMNPVSGTAVT